MRILAFLILLCASSVHAAITWTCTINFKNPLASGYVVAGTCASDTGTPTGATGDPLTWSQVCGSGFQKVATAVFSAAIAPTGGNGWPVSYDAVNQKLQIIVQGTAGATVQMVAYTTTAATTLTTTRYIAICQ